MTHQKLSGEHSVDIQNRFEDFAPIIRNLSALTAGERLSPKLLMEREGDLEIYYAPFDAINRDARVVLVGITPGMTQAVNALKAAREHLRAGASFVLAAEAAKREASFSGKMRKPLVEMLDHFGLQRWLSIDSTAALFANQKHLVHYTSLLRYPVFVKGKNYSGAPAMLRTPLLHRYVEDHFLPEMKALPKAIFIPLGSTVQQVFDQLMERDMIDARQVISGFPHPSGANRERIIYLLGRKPRQALSSKTNPDLLDRARMRLHAQIEQLLTQRVA